MVFLMLILLLFGVVAVAAALGLTPDSHRETCQHGDFRF